MFSIKLYIHKNFVYVQNLNFYVKIFRVIDCRKSYKQNNTREKQGIKKFLSSGM